MRLEVERFDEALTLEEEGFAAESTAGRARRAGAVRAVAALRVGDLRVRDEVDDIADRVAIFWALLLTDSNREQPTCQPALSDPEISTNEGLKRRFYPCAELNPGTLAYFTPTT